MSPALVAVVASAGLWACGGDPAGVRVVIESDEAVVLDVVADVARTADERRQGLRGQPPLAPGAGLLLDFPVEGEVCLFNDGVSFAIDAVYAAADGQVRAVERGIPAGDAGARCHEGVQQVLEVAAGEAGAVSLGDRLQVR